MGDLVTKHDQGLSTYSPSPEQKQEIKDAVGTVKKSKAGKTLASYAQQAQQANSTFANARSLRDLASAPTPAALTAATEEPTAAERKLILREPTAAVPLIYPFFP